MIVGFSGSQTGPTPGQRAALARIMRRLTESSAGPNELHHGDCVGSDAVAHEIARSLGWRIVAHPPTNPAKRAFCEGASLVLPPRPYLTRNGDIAAECDMLLATPETSEEVLRSGTWSTIRRARALGKRVLILGPDGVNKIEHR